MKSKYNNLSQASSRRCNAKEATTDRLTFLNMISEAGIEFTAHLVDGCFILTPDEVFNYLEDPNLFAARKHGVTLEHWLAWKDFIEDPHCYAITKKGKPCRGWICGVGLEDFIPGVSEYCRVHQGYVYK